jgi:hypothetical protein
MLTLIDASSIQSIPAAIQRADEFGMKTNAIQESTAPTKK